MALVVTGRLNKQIASELGTSEKTVKAQRGTGDGEDARDVGCRTRPHGGSPALIANSSNTQGASSMNLFVLDEGLIRDGLWSDGSP